MSADSEKRASSDEPSTRGRWLRAETALALAGVLIAIGFVLPWFDAVDGRVSGLDLTARGGAWVGLAAIPGLGVLTALLGALGWRVSRYTAIAASVAVLVPAAVTLATRWPWLATVPVIAGLSLFAIGALKRGLRASPLVGVALFAAVAAVMWLQGGEPILPDEENATRLFGLRLPAAIPLLALSAAAAIAAGALIVAGLRKRGRERALMVAGSSIVGLGAYAAALDGFGVELATSGVGAWMTGGALLLFLAVLLTTRSVRTQRAAKAAGDKADGKASPPAKPDKAKTKAKTKTRAKAKAKATAAEASQAKPAAAATEAKANPPARPETPAASDAPASDEKAKLEKLAKLKKLKRLKELRAQEVAAAKEAKAAEAEDEATAKAGEALASEPEPVFASDPSAAPPPKDEDRDALMRRVGVKKPAPPSDNELEAMLAALKSRSDDE